MYKDIKLENIFIKFQKFFLFKLINFRFAKNIFILKTFYRTDLYAIFEIWKCNTNIFTINILLLTIIILKYKYGLFKLISKRKSICSYYNIWDIINDCKKKKNIFIDFFSINMLKIKY